MNSYFYEVLQRSFKDWENQSQNKQTKVYNFSF